MVSNVRLDHIDKNPYQTRYLFDQELLEELADSIRVNGVVQPVVVRPAEEEGRYVLILGERRCRASKMAGKESVPAIVRRVSEQQAAEMTVIENLQRQDLNCLEQAEAFRLLSKEFNLTQEEIGKRVGMSRESVSNYMRLLRLPAEVMEYLAHGQIGFSEAREMLSLDDATKIPALAEEIVKKHMSVEQIEMMVSRMNGWLDPVPGMPGQEKEKKRAGSRWQDPNVRAAQLELERTLGLRVRIRDKKGKGKILIEYSNVDDYERVVGMLRGKKG
jgi:ParB family chromosome partitioning protein